MINFDYSKATSAKTAITALLRTPAAQYIAGGTNLVDLMKRGVTAPEKLIDITALPYKGIELKNGKVFIGAMALNSDVAASEVVQTHVPLLSQALKAGASMQIRNMATVGGNLMQRTRCPYFFDTAMPCNKRRPGSGCSALNGYNRMHAIFGASAHCIAVHPSDMAVALAALDATVVVQHATGERRINMLDFHRLPGSTPQQDNTLRRGELITAIEVPVRNITSHYNKVRDRASYAFALVSVAAAAEIQGGLIRQIRLAMGGVAHKPWRLLRAENFLKGKSPTEENFRKAAALEMVTAKGFGYNNFKLKLAPHTLVETLKQITT